MLSENESYLRSQINEYLIARLQQPPKSHSKLNPRAHPGRDCYRNAEAFACRKGRFGVIRAKDVYVLARQLPPISEFDSRNTRIVTTARIPPSEMIG